MSPALATLAGTLAVQTLATLVLTAPSVLAPAVAPTLGYGADRVGVFVGVAYLAAMLSGLGSGGWAARIGAVRLSQVAMASCALGALAVTLGQPAALLLAAVTVGIGYGMINPATSSLLARHAPANRRGLFFSIKQTGVPLGVAGAGLLMPLGFAALGWRPAMALAAAACVALALALRPLVAKLEPPAGAVAPRAGGAAATGSWLAGLATVLRDPALRRLSLASFSFAFTQLCFTTFLVSYLKLELGQSLATAAAILAGSQVVSTLSRIGWGHVADRWVGSGLLLGVLGVAMGLACAGLALLGESAGTGLAILAAVACAATIMGWNGVFFAELARQAGGKDMATLAGASQFITFAGSMSGPVAFAEIIRLGGSYGGAYLALAALPLVSGAVMLRASWPARRAARPRADQSAPRSP
ncbi:MFS transporter [Burkholderiaceae bacterium FT117]|uniref:MFS transporter n=1 Tax=Zeimonas sediminis TaxID=2944268 RepID=UPI002342E378|nr:MFS transporter [Zeimonas sediminis]MCM5571349.1 MFS transporter [Zeimonas sediminis]